MELNDRELGQVQSQAGELTPDEEALWLLLASYMGRTDHPGLCLSEQTVAWLEQLCPAIEGQEHEVSSLVSGLERAAIAVDYETKMQSQRQDPSLGSYISFLLQRAGLMASQAADEADWEFCDLQELQRNHLSPERISAPRLAALMKHLEASLEMVERLLPTTIQVPRYQYAGSRGSLYRGASRATRSASEEVSLAARGEQGQRYEHPDYAEQLAAAQRLGVELREAWRTTPDTALDSTPEELLPE